MPPNARDSMLERIKQALSSTTPVPLPAVARVGHNGSEDLVEVFTAAAVRANAEIERVETRGAIPAKLVALCHESQAKSITLSAAAARAPWNLGNESIAAGLDVIVAPHQALEHITDAEVVVTIADYAVADTGTVISLASAGEGRLDSVLTPLHVAIVPSTAILPDLWALFAEVQRRQLLVQHSAMVMITGPSRTADIELTLTVGVHGPKRLRVLIVQDSVTEALLPEDP